MNDSLNNEIRTRFPHLSEIDCLEIGLLVLEKEKKAMQETWELTHKLEYQEQEIENII